jgi:hypothetical protein
MAGDLDPSLSTLKGRSENQSEPAPARSMMLLRTAPGFERCFGVQKWRSKVEKRSFLDRDSCQCNNMRWSDPVVTTPQKDATGRRCSSFSSLACPDAQLFQSLIAWEHGLCGFTNRDIRAQLQTTPHLRACGHDHRKQSAKISRIFRRCHAHGLIAKIPHTRRWRVTGYGRQVMGTSLYLHEHHFPNVYATIAA